MVELFCALVGTQVALSVEINADESVGILKQKIKDQKKNALKDVDADNLQLFLAKRNDAWLTEAQVAKGVTDTTGYSLLRFARATLKEVGLLEEDVQFESTSEDVKVGNNIVHVLVEISEMPPRKKKESG
ncbi:hypothetical protein P3T76_007029 [Phytophthora citrophthora]|uniref:Crinkler effector protein N-terminal domain-containing protein n=1 Tax=Phytophthora citrophthora TaxID=4793 RepID=A0AAD9GN50_9STRA|nr:hypothetical protein P3T76_007029 [Phytophthora citrophthora]